jgi:3'-phosphoadenosine 5'-phosphosulfate sulfotransferase (PAPS reductase)/FAD synthetase
MDKITTKNLNADVKFFVAKQPLVTLGFSTGKDSLCCAVMLKKMGVPFIPFYFYQIPDLSFINKNIRLYERLLEISIVRYPHPMLYDYLRHQDFQPPDMIKYLVEYDLPKLTFADIISCHLISIGIDYPVYDITGQRAGESFNRRKHFEKEGFINHNKCKINMIADWNKADVMNYLKANDVPLTNDYKIWNRSFDGLKYQFLFGVKENYPEDYDKIKKMFPLVDLEIKRYEFNREYFR